MLFSSKYVQNSLLSAYGGREGDRDENGDGSGVGRRKARAEMRRDEDTRPGRNEAVMIEQATWQDVYSPHPQTWPGGELGFLVDYFAQFIVEYFRRGRRGSAAYYNIEQEKGAYSLQSQYDSDSDEEESE